jgi:subtilisin family serine protease
MKNMILYTTWIALLLSTPLLFSQAKPTSPRLAEPLSAVELVANTNLNPADEKEAEQFDKTFEKPIQINDGRKRSYILAVDELYQPTPDGVGQIVLIKESSKPSTLASVANILALEKKQETRLILYPVGAPHNDQTRRILSRDIVVRFNDRDKAIKAANIAGLRLDFESPYAPGVATFATDSPAGALSVINKLREQGFSCSLTATGVTQKGQFLPNDPLFNSEWHIRGRGQNGAKKASDAKITPVWEQRDSSGNLIRGHGIVIGVIDSGVQWSHPDLKNNYVANLSYDFASGDSDPSPGSAGTAYDSHGTSVAGVSAAQGFNGIGVCGVAPESQIAAIRVGLGGLSDVNVPFDDKTMSKAFSYGGSLTRILNNSWGTGIPVPDSVTYEFDPPVYSLPTLAGETAKGKIFIFAAGNDLQTFGNTNFHYNQNSIYTIPVAAVNDFAYQCDYSTPGASIVISAPSGFDQSQLSSSRPQGTSTTDMLGTVGANTGVPLPKVINGKPYQPIPDYTDLDYTNIFNGTSSAAPVVSGVTALVLQANSSLNWRDVKEIYIRSATKNDPSDSDWARNGAGFSFNHKYGAGLINASDAVRLAKSWSNLGTMTSVSVSLSSLPATIRDNNASGLVKYFDTRSLSGLRVEHATLTTDITHPSRGELEIQLTSPDGTTSRLAEKHTSYAADPADYPDWTFSTVHNWGEDSRGLWKLKIADRISGNTGTLNSATLTLYGTAK